jgi:hypothetical protein
MKNLHLLPTDKPTRLWTNNLRRRLELDEFPERNPTNIAKHIYITSDEDINENDYIITQDGRLVQVSYLLSKDLEGASKVILTTDPDLIKDSVQAIDDEFLEWFVKNPSGECVEVEKIFVTNSGLGYEEYAVLDSNFKVIEINAKIPQRSYYLGKVTILNTYEYVINYKIIIPKEKPKQLTLEEAIKQELENHFFSNVSEIKKAEYFINFGAKWQAERMYRKDDMINFAWFLIENIGQYSDDRAAHFEGKYLEQFKKSNK